MIYFLSEQRIKDFTTVLGNVDAKLIAPLIMSAADQWVKPRTGTHFFNDLLNKYNAQTLSADEKTLVTAIQNSLMWRIAAELVITTSSQITNKGPQEQNGINSNASDITKLGMLTAHYGNKADFYDARIIHLIWHNKDKFPAFTDKLNRDCNADLYPSKSDPYNDIIFF